MHYGEMCYTKFVVPMYTANLWLLKEVYRRWVYVASVRTESGIVIDWRRRGESRW